MMDHLHPTYQGNKIIASQIHYKIIDLKLIEKNNEQISAERIISDSLNFRQYTILDSIFSELRINILKSDFPFVGQKITQSWSKSNEEIEKITAREIVAGTNSWENAHLKLALHYLNKKDYFRYTEEMYTLIEDKPFDQFAYLEAIRQLEKADQSHFLKYILEKFYKYHPNIKTAGKLADLYFIAGNHQNAVFFYKITSNKIVNDPRIFFNLSASYFALKDIPNAVNSIQACLKVDPEYPNAKRIYNGLVQMYSSSKN
jgi:tetratricopeptide (TPR) repeat protein